MFNKIKGLFETYSQSSSKQKDETLRNVTVKMGPSMLAKSIIEILKKLKYKKITYNEVYNEIFTYKAGYEVTVHLIASSGGSTIIEVAVFAPEHRGKTRKALRYLLHTFKEEFKSYLSHE